MLTELSPAALPALVADLASADPALPAVYAPEATAAEFARLWTARVGGRARPGAMYRLYRLERVVAPEPVAVGEMRAAATAHAGLVASWMEAFGGEARLPVADPRFAAERAIRRRTLFVWADGAPVAMAVVVGETPNGERPLQPRLERDLSAHRLRAGPRCHGLRAERGRYQMSENAVVTAGPIGQAALSDLGRELAGTRRVLERIPLERADWRPHEKSYTLGDLAVHVANLAWWGVMTVQRDEIDLAVVALDRTIPESAEALVARFDRNVAELREALATLRDEALEDTWTLRVGERVVLSWSRLDTLRAFCANHMIHHRAQLTVYLRLLDVPVPGLYGPSADEQ